MLTQPALYVFVQGPCPLEVIVAKDALILLEEDLENSKFLAIFGGKNLTDIDKVQLGKELGFIHHHGPRKTVLHPSWWVTHSTKFIKQLVIGAPKMIQNLPWVGVYKLPTGMDQVAFGFQKEHAGWPKFAVNKSYEVCCVLLNSFALPKVDTDRLPRAGVQPDLDHSRCIPKAGRWLSGRG